jgi:hypothetical protein
VAVRESRVENRPDAHLVRVRAGARARARARARVRS